MYLKTTLQEIINTESQHVIELHAGVIQDTNTDETTNESVTLKETLGVLLLESQELTGSTTILRVSKPRPVPSSSKLKTGGRPYRILERVS